MRVEVHNRERLFDDFLKVDAALFRFERFDGSMSREVRRLTLSRGDSVAAILFHSERRRVLLIEQFRWATYDHGQGWLQEVAAGMIEPGESPEEAIVREIEEELGYRVESLETITTFYVSPGGTSERVVLLGGEVSDMDRTREAGGVDAEDEDIRVIEVTLADLAANVRDGTLVDAKSIIAASWLLERHGVPLWTADPSAG